MDFVICKSVVLLPSQHLQYFQKGIVLIRKEWKSYYTEILSSREAKYEPRIKRKYNLTVTYSHIQPFFPTAFLNIGYISLTWFLQPASPLLWLKKKKKKRLTTNQPQTDGSTVLVDLISKIRYNQNNYSLEYEVRVQQSWYLLLFFFLCFFLLHSDTHPTLNRCSNNCHTSNNKYQRTSCS